MWTSSKERLRKAGVYLEADDDGVLDAIMETGGEFARTKVEFDTAANIELTRRGQRGGADRPAISRSISATRSPEFPAYTGEPGSKFATGKDLGWHRGNTAGPSRPPCWTRCAEATGDGDDDVQPRRRCRKDGIVYDLIDQL